jgi:hypothetical protein
MSKEVLIAVYGTDDLSKSFDGEGLSCEEFSNGGSEIFLKQDSPTAASVPMAKTARAAVSAQQRFEEVCAKVRKVFAANPSEAEEAIALAKQIRTEARAAVIAAV